MAEQQIKVGIVSCSGEDLCEGTISRLAARRVLEELRPAQTVTICLPLFLAGDEQERAFARFYPTIVVDGCEKRCAKRGTEAHSGPVSAALVVSEVLPADMQLSGERSGRKLTSTDLAAVGLVAGRIAREVDAVLAAGGGTAVPIDESAEAVCSCARPLPSGELNVNGRAVHIAGLPLIFQRLASEGLKPDETCGVRLLEVTKIYHPISTDEEPLFEATLAEAYKAYCAKGSG